MSNEATIPLVLALDDNSATLAVVGGKGTSLARMASAGLPVPPGFHITTTAYQRFIAENELQDKIIAIISAITPADPAILEEAAQQISQLFASSMLSDTIATEIRLAYVKLGNGNMAVAVRSSATAEDLPEMSFAGQQETYLNIHGEAKVIDAVKRCWASLWTARAIGYRARHAIAPQDVSLAVVVQELIPADAAGILFTADPLTGEQDHFIINAAWGLGEAIVSGQVTPDTVIVDKASKTIIKQEIGKKDLMTVRASEGTYEQAVPIEQQRQAVLTPPQAAELARFGILIEQLYELPMDIEWILRDNHIFIVQARPITALPDTARSTEADSTTQAIQPIKWEPPNPKGLYMRNSVIELLPDPLTPLFATLALPFWDKAMNQLLTDIGWGKLLQGQLLVTINGYAYYYYDMSAMKSQTFKAFLLIPGSFARMARFLRSARLRWEQEARPAYTKIADQWQTTNLQMTSATLLLEGVQAITDEAAKYYLSIQSGILPAAYMSEALFTAFYNKLIKHHNDPAAPTFVMGYRSMPIQAEQAFYDIAQWACTQPPLAETLSNITGTQFIRAYQSKQIVGIKQENWSEFCQRFATYLEHFGHTIYDLDFAKALPADAPTSLLETLKFFMSGTAQNPYQRQEENAARRERARRTILARLWPGPRRSLFRRLLKWAQDLAPLREDALADVGLGWPIIRCMLREIGQRLQQAHAITAQDDIFWLTLDEIHTAVHTLDRANSLENYQTVIAERQATWKRQSKVTPPVSLPLKEGVRFWGRDWSDMMPARSEQQTGNVIKGIGASAGHITGMVKVIHGPDEFNQMRPGDILVARITTPAWTPLFALAAGIITDVGGPLSHSSIVAREYHIPAVLGTGVATELLHSGQRVTIDGDAGTVSIG